MSNTLKMTLTHSIQLMGYNFIYLDLGFTHTAKLQIPHLEKLGVSIDRLRITVERLPASCERIDRGVRHDIRNELSIISTRVQLLHLKNAEELGRDSSLYIQNILAAGELIIKALETSKALNAS